MSVMIRLSGDRWAPPGCNWCAMILPDGTLALAYPEVGGSGGPFRALTDEEKIALNLWIKERFGTDDPPLDRGYRAEWDPRR